MILEMVILFSFASFFFYIAIQVTGEFQPLRQYLSVE